MARPVALRDHLRRQAAREVAAARADPVAKAEPAARRAAVRAVRAAAVWRARRAAARVVADRADPPGAAVLAGPLVVVQVAVARAERQEWSAARHRHLRRRRPRSRPTVWSRTTISTRVPV